MITAEEAVVVLDPVSFACSEVSDYIRRLKFRRMRLADLRATRANRVFCTDKKHPYRKHGYG